MNSPTTASSTASDRTLTIEGMSGDTCVSAVTAALKNVPQVRIHSVKVGTASINADDAGRDAAVAAVAKTGFKVHDASNVNDSHRSNQSTNASQSRSNESSGMHSSAPSNQNKSAAPATAPKSAPSMR